MTEDADKVRVQYLEGDIKLLRIDIKSHEKALSEIEKNQSVILQRLDEIDSQHASRRESVGKWVERGFFSVLAAAAWFRDYLFAR